MQDIIPCNLTVRQIAKSLMPHMAKLEKNYVNQFKDITGIEINDDNGDWEKNVMEEFLLFPPDLFALTSSILSITGAYHLVVSPPRYTQAKTAHSEEYAINWRPYDEKWIEKTFTGKIAEKGKEWIWVDKVRNLGIKWRMLLDERFKEEAFTECKILESEVNSTTRVNLIKDKVGLLIEKIQSDNKKELKWVAPESSAKWIPDEVRYYWEEFRRSMSPVKFCHEANFGTIEDLLCDEEVLRKEGKTEELPNIWRSFCALITLHAIADEACVGWGLRKMEGNFIKKNQEKLIIQEYYKVAHNDPAYQSVFDNILHHLIKRKEAENGLIPAPETNAELSTDERKETEKDSASNRESDTGSAYYSQLYAENLLKRYGTMSTINNLRARILPKRHTPSVGITLRALSSNLAFHRSSIDVKWRTENEVENGLIDKMEKHSPKERTFSILLLPWALDISPLDFTTVTPDPRLNMKEDFGFFAYSPREKSIDTDFLIDTLNGTKKVTPDIDLIVLPECALDKDELGEFEKIIGTNFNVGAYVAGVRKSNNNNEQKHFHDNMVVFRVGTKTHISGTEVIDFGSIKDEEIQHKHHRWRLNRSQIETYNLGHILSPNKDWWEAIKIRRRKVTFVNIGDELTICPLICEDLARQDPIADLVRTVGPSLVITILMDGPQKKERWSAKYASVLAEDPGCAALTLTSLGMVKRSLPPNVPPSRVVALWNDGISFAREIELKEGAVGILLSLSVESRTEIMADGREEFKSTNCVKLGGIHQIYHKNKE